LLRQARHGRIRLAASVSLFIEYESVCTREPHLLAAGLSLQSAGVFLDALAAFVEPVPIHFLWRPQLHDPADELVLEAAVNAAAGGATGTVFARVFKRNPVMSELSTYPLRLPRSIRASLDRVSKRDGVSINQFVSIAVAEKLAMMEAQTYFVERQARADVAAFDAVMARTTGEPPREDDRILPAQNS